MCGVCVECVCVECVCVECVCVECVCGHSIQCRIKYCPRCDRPTDYNSLSSHHTMHTIKSHNLTFPTVDWLTVFGVQHITLCMGQTFSVTCTT